MCDDKPRIGFVILVWNSGKVIDKCLKSITALREVRPYVAVVDNGSTDRTPDIISRYRHEYPDIFEIITFSVNKGATVSRNAGLKLLMSRHVDYYCVLDSDTEVNDDAFTKMIHEMKTHPQYGIIGPSMSDSKGVLQVSARCFPTITEKIFKAVPLKFIQRIGERMEIQHPSSDDAKSYPVDYLMSACWLIRSDVIDESALLFDEKIFYAPEDAEYCIRVWKSGYQVAFCPSAWIIHEWQRLSKKKLFSRHNWEHLKGLAYMFRKHGYCFSTGRLRKTFMKGEKD